MDTGALSQPHFRLPENVSIGTGIGGLPRVLIRDAGSEAEIYLNGATVTRYDVGSRHVLFCSRSSRFEAGKAIRGGVPVIFPWFGPHPTDPAIPQHGLVRSAPWVFASAAGATGATSAVFTLESSAETRRIWPFDFGISYTVTVGRRLQLALEVTNRSSVEFQFSEALHTYLAVSDVRNITISGLEGTEYVDKVAGLSRSRLGSEPLRLTGETDRVFIDTAAECVLRDPVLGDTRVSKEGSLSTVVWNPWEGKAEGLADLSGGQWPGMVCIETCNTMDNEVTLRPGAAHTMKAIVAPG